LADGAVDAGPSSCTIAVDVTPSSGVASAITCPDPKTTNDADNVSGLSDNLVLTEDFQTCVNVTLVSDIAVAATATTPVTPGGTSSLTVKLSNDGPSPATDIPVTIDAPPGLTFTEAPAGCTLNAESTTATCSVASLIVGEATDITATLSVPAAAEPGTLTGAVTVAHPGDPNNGNDTAATQSLSATPPLTCRSARPHRRP
jgi:uncharacterized repeat protein (TIGR01451 family)